MANGRSSVMDEPDLRFGNNGFSCSDLLGHEGNRRALRELLFCVPAALQYHSGVIFFEETLYQKTKDGKPFVNFLDEGGVPLGIKVDKGTIEVAGTDKETTTEGHDDLGKRCTKYYVVDAHFAKWLGSAGASAPELTSKYIFMMSIGDDGGFGSEGTLATHTTGSNHQSGTDLATNHKPSEVILDTGAEVNVTGDGAMFVPVSYEPKGFGLRAANGNKIESYLCGYLSHERYHINYVYFSEDVGPRTIISGPELDLLGYTLKFEGGKCEVRDKGILVGKGCLVEKKKYLMEYLRIPLDRAPVQVTNEETVPVPDGPAGLLAVGRVFTPVWTAIRTVLRRFSA